jgi:general secretion pathway protein L
MTVTDALRSLRATGLGSSILLDGLLERWRDALLSCLPREWRRLLERREQTLIVVPRGATAGVLLSRGDESVSMGELDPKAPGSLQAVLAGAKGTKRKILVQLAADQVLKREVAFPSQVRDNLTQVLSYEMDRLSPFQSDQVYFDFRVLADATPRDKVRLELALCPRAQVQDWLRCLREVGAPVDLLTWEGGWPKANLLPLEERPRRGSGPFSIGKLFALLVLLLAAAALVTPIWQMQKMRDTREAQISELKARAEEVNRTRTALEQARHGSTEVLQRKLEQPRIIDLLLELTERLPDNTWVQNMDYRDGEIQIRGESSQATSLINLLDQGPGISEVSFGSPVVQIRGSDRERFQISLKYKSPGGS